MHCGHCPRNVTWFPATPSNTSKLDLWMFPGKHYALRVMTSFLPDFPHIFQSVHHPLKPTWFPASSNKTSTRHPKSTTPSLHNTVFIPRMFYLYPVLRERARILHYQKVGLLCVCGRGGNLTQYYIPWPLVVMHRHGTSPGQWAVSRSDIISTHSCPPSHSQHRDPGLNC